MADNVTVDNGALTDYPVATDDDGTAQHQYIKVEFGGDGTFTKVTDAVGLPVRQTDITASGTITTQNLVPAGTATANSAVLSGDLNGASSLMFQVTGTYTGALSVQGTVDNTNWITLSGGSTLLSQTGAYSATVTSAAVGIYVMDAAGYRQLRVTGLAAMTGTATVTMRATNGTATVAIDNSLPAGTAIIGALSANQSTNVAQMNGATVTMGNGTSGTGVQRVTVASDSTGALISNGPAAVDAAISGNPIHNGGRASTATPTAMSADNDVVSLWLDRSGATVNTGYVAEDGVLAGNPIRQGVRAHSGVPTAMSADNDVVTPWGDRSGALVVVPQPRTGRFTATPTIATSGYVAGDQVGGLLTFTSAALASGRSGQVVQAVLTSRTVTALNDLELWLFNASPTIASSDNAAWDLTDGNLESAQFIGAIDFLADNYAVSASNAVCSGVPLNVGGPMPTFVTSGSANLFGVLVARTVAAQYGGTTDVVVALTVNQF